MAQRRTGAGEAARRALAMRLRVMGFRYSEIAEASFPAFGPGPLFANPALARKAVAAALKEAAEDTETERRLQAQRLDLLLTGSWGKSLGGDGPGIDRQLAIETRRARLLALDLPDAGGALEAASNQAAAAEIAEKLQRYADALNRAAGGGNGAAHPGNGSNGAIAADVPAIQGEGRA